MASNKTKNRRRRRRRKSWGNLGNFILTLNKKKERRRSENPLQKSKKSKKNS